MGARSFSPLYPESRGWCQGQSDEQCLWSEWRNSKGVCPMGATCPDHPSTHTHQHMWILLTLRLPLQQASWPWLPLCRQVGYHQDPTWHRWESSTPGLPQGRTSCKGQNQIFWCQFLPVLAWLLFLTWPTASHRWGSECLGGCLYSIFSLFIFYFENRELLFNGYRVWEEE